MEFVLKIVGSRDIRNIIPNGLTIISLEKIRMKVDLTEYDSISIAF